MDKTEFKMMRPIPQGYYRVMDGDILPDDLCLSVMTGEWIRFDDPRWLSPSARAEEAFMVVRKARHVAAVNQSVRSYAVSRSEEPPAEVEPTVITELFDSQRSLFG